MAYHDKDKIIDYIEEFTDKTFILEIPKNISADDIEWDIYKSYAEKVNFILCLHDLNLVNICHKHNIKFYWIYPVFTWYELKGLINLKPCYITVSAPLSFSLEDIKKKTNIPLRMVPNLAYDAYIPRENGIFGSWIRPEDISVYEDYIDVCDFVTDELSKEATLLHIYKDKKEWLGNLNLLLTNFNVHVDNRAIPEEIGKMRVNCGQRCMSGGACRFCETAINLSNAIREKHYKNKKDAALTHSENNN